MLFHNRSGPVIMQKGPSIYYVSKGLGGLENRQVPYLFWVDGWVRKIQNYADVIYGLSPSLNTHTYKYSGVQMLSIIIYA